MRPVILIVVIALLASVAVAQTGILSMLFPDKSVAITTDECLGNAECRIPSDLGEKVCTQEGQYTLNFQVSGDADSSQELNSNAHLVNWDTEKYCRGSNLADLPICFESRTVNFSAAANTCCGAHPATNCGKLFGTEACTNPTASPDVWEYMRVQENKGDIFGVECARSQLVSDGGQFLSCGLLSGLQSSYPSFELINIVEPGRDPSVHGYMCAEETPENNETIKTIIECAGGQAAFNDKGGHTAQPGEFHVLGELYAADLGASDKIITGAVGNYNSALGRIKIQFAPSWDGDDGRDRTFFSARQTANSFISIEKRRDHIGCYNTVGANSVKAEFNISQIKKNTLHTITYVYSGGTMSCTFDGQAQSRSGFSPVSAAELFVNTGPPGASSADSPMRVSVSENPSSPTRYCTTKAQWVTNLDTEDFRTCTDAGLRFTGTKCCSEDEDLPSEFYVDPNTENYTEEKSGACYNSTHAKNGLPVNNTNGSVLTVLGEFHGCQLNETNPSLLLLKDVHTNLPLIKDQPRCKVAFNLTRTLNVNRFCSFNGSWVLTPRQDRLAPREVPDEVREALPARLNATARPVECCAQSQCFNGNSCVNDQTNETRPTSTGGFRCLNGTWIKQTIKGTFDNRELGFCPRDDQCLLNPEGNISVNDNPDAFFTTDVKQQPACIANRQFINQTFCNNGTWTSRTKILGHYLIDHGESFSANNYTIFCDNFNEVLNFIDYEAFPNAGSVNTYLGEKCAIRGISVPCVNQFCVIKYKSGVGFAASLNTPVNDTARSFLNALGKSNLACNSVVSNIDGRFHSCGSNIFYNPSLNSIMFLPAGTISSQTLDEALRQSDAYVRTRFSDLVNFARNRTLLEARADFLNQTTIFDTLYINKVAPKDLFAFLEKDRFNSTPVDYLAARYINVNVTDPTGKNLCDLLNERIKADQNKDCLTSAASTRFVAFTTSGFGNLRDVWRDFTAKLRK